MFVDGIKTLDDLDTYTTRLVEQGIPCLYNGQLQPAPELAGATGESG